MHGLKGGGWKRKRPGHGHHRWDDLAGNRRNADPGTYHRLAPPRLPPTLLRGRRAEADVRPDRRGRGIGTWLLDWTERRAGEVGADRVGQTITDHNVVAARMFGS